MPNLIPTKFLDFKGLERNANQPDRISNLLRVKNMVTHDKPGTLKLRQGYELRYAAPTDPTYLRIENPEFVSFDNFFERTAGKGTEITVEVQRGEIVAPTVNGSKLNDYKFRAANIWMRPYWKGSYWVDAWQWMNESYITNITVAVDATYHNKIQFEGYFGNLTQWSVVNVTKDSRLPASVLRTAENGTNTDCWLSLYDSGWEVDDVIVLMRNYIPLEYQHQNYDVLRKEISFHRVLSKMRIGFGGKEARVGYGIEYIKRTVQLADYDLGKILLVDPVLTDTEYIWATGNKVVVQPYIEFNYNAEDYILNVDTETGDYVPGTYYFRATAVLDGINEVMVAEEEIVVGANSKFLPALKIRAGSLSRRLTSIKFYFSTTGDDYYLFNEVTVAIDGDKIAAKDLRMDESGYLTFVSVASAINIHTEPNAASPSDIDAVGSWESHQPTGVSLTSVAATNFALEFEGILTNLDMNIRFPLTALDEPLKPGRKYDVAITAITNAPTEGALGIGLLFDSGGGFYQKIGLASTFITSSYVIYNLEITIPETHVDEFEFLAVSFGGSGIVPIGTTVGIELITIIEQDTDYADLDTELGTQMLTELGYQATFNLVRDWMQGVVRRGITWLAGSFIKDDGRYDNKIFGSQISGLSANMHDVIPAQTYLDVDRYKGEVIVGMAVLSNSSLCVIKDGAAIILDPETGQIYETAIGYGGVIKNSILVIRGTIYWNAQDDIMSMNAATGYIADQISDRYVRDLYQAITDKTTAHACLDRYGAYRIALVDDKEDVANPELLLTERGWMEQERYHHPQVYRNGLAGRVWFMNDGNIYAFPFDEEAFIGYADVYGNYDSGW